MIPGNCYELSILATITTAKNRKYRPSEKQKPDPAVARANQRLASRFYQLKTDRTVPCVDYSTPGRQLLVVLVKI